MSLPLAFHVPEAGSPNPLIFALLEPPPLPLLLTPARAPWLVKIEAEFAVEYENPDLTKPSVSSF